MRRAGAISSSRSASPHGDMVCLARIVRPHGVQGAVWLQSFTSPPEALKAYAPLRTKAGRSLAFTHLQASGERLRARFVGVESRDAAEALAGEFLFAPRRQLPRRAANTWYHAELIGLTAQDEKGAELGKIVGVHDFGAGPLLEVRPPQGESFFLPFRRDHVPNIDVAKGCLVVKDWKGFV